MTPNDVQRFDEPTQHSAQRVENACDRLTYSQRWTQGWTQSRTRWTRIFANRPRRDVVRATHQDERSAAYRPDQRDIGPGDRRGRAFARARTRERPGVPSDFQRGHGREAGEEFASRSGHRCCPHAIVLRKARAGFFLLRKNLRPTLSRLETGAGFVFGVLRHPPTRRSSGLTSESRKPSRGSLEVRNETDVCAEAGLASSDQDVQATASCAEAVGVLIRTNGSPPQS